MALGKFESGLVGVFVGLVGAAGIVSLVPTDINAAREFQRGDKPSIIRLYRNGARDGILVQDKENGKYVRLNEYLKTIQNEADRNIEEVEIKKSAEWYK